LATKEEAAGLYIYKEGLEWAFLINETLDELFS
jgi:hypothetical protein